MARVAYGYAPRDPTEVLGRRISAYLIDLILGSIVTVALLSWARHSSYYGATADACSSLRGGSSMCFQLGDRVYVWNRASLWRAELASAGVWFANLVVLQGLVGATVGKLVVGLRVVNGQGAPAGFLRTAGRWLFLAVDAGCFVVGLVSVVATHPHQRVGDLVCGTYVVARASVGIPPRSGYGPNLYGAAGPGAWPPAPSGRGRWTPAGRIGETPPWSPGPPADVPAGNRPPPAAPDAGYYGTAVRDVAPAPGPTPITKITNGAAAVWATPPPPKHEPSAPAREPAPPAAEPEPDAP